MAEATDAPLLSTPLANRHRALGARMVPFAGYDMPVQYPTGIMTEHNWTRAHAGLFDVSHMGQAFLVPADGKHETAAAALEALCPADILNLKPYQQRYSQLLNDEGGILDDFMATRAGSDRTGSLYVVVNAGCKEADYAHLQAKLPSNVKLERADHYALVALQGPEANAVIAAHVPDIDSLAFMTYRIVTIGGVAVHISRSGYTGEDGFEISVRVDKVGDLWDLLLKDARVKPIGLGARDSLRLEAGLCLYGHDIDVTTSPVEGALVWSMQKRRREGGGFPGADRIQRELRDKPKRTRVGFSFEGRAPAREGAEVRVNGRAVGVVTSGGFGPTVNAPVAMGYVETAFATPGAAVEIIVRDRPLAAKIAAMPFAPHRYKR
ncbi:glycine cleavage system aminomethyltransferase GcvT [Terrarubrum flagellatum]|uniref:glycine cleavage system aminomethyltransferase GcvT n=1 Tax=Terrirubrum flagellatum TaxID=2895980 RepID=UPI0031451332